MGLDLSVGPHQIEAGGPEGALQQHEDAADEAREDERTKELDRGFPAVVGAGVFELKEIPHGHNDYGWGPTITATVVSFVVGYAAIAWLLRYVSTRSYTPFVLYRVALGLATFALLGAGVLSA